MTDAELYQSGAAILERLSLADQAELAVGSLDGREFGEASIAAIKKVEGGNGFMVQCGSVLNASQFAGIFGEMDKYSQIRMKERLERTHPGAIGRIVDSLVFFEDFANLKPGELFRVLSEFSEQTILEALEGAGPDERSAILSTLESPRADKVRSMLKIADPVPMEAVEKAQHSMEETARRLGCTKDTP